MDSNLILHTLKRCALYCHCSRYLMQISILLRLVHQNLCASMLSMSLKKNSWESPTWSTLEMPWIRCRMSRCFSSTCDLESVVDLSKDIEPHVPKKCSNGCSKACYEATLWSLLPYTHSFIRITTNGKNISACVKLPSFSCLPSSNPYKVHQPK